MPSQSVSNCNTANGPLKASNANWIRNQTFDLVFVFGGAVVGLLFVLFSQKFSLTALRIAFWLWFCCLDCPHLASSWVRSYLNPDFRNQQRTTMWISLLWFVPVPLAFLLSKLTHRPQILEATSIAISVWLVYHFCRQHYGFVKLYLNRSPASEETKQFFKWAVYAVAIPLPIFMVAYRLCFFILRYYDSHSEVIHFFDPQLYRWMFPFMLVTLGYLGVIGYRLYIGAPSYKATGKAYAYMVLCFVWFYLAYPIVAPFTQLPNTTTAVPMMIRFTIFASIFHNIQYLAIVWHRENENIKIPNFYLGNIKTIVLVALLSLLIVAFMGITNGIPFWKLGDVASRYGIAHLWFYTSLIANHCYLDQRIWKPKDNKDLYQVSQLPLDVQEMNPMFAG